FIPQTSGDIVAEHYIVHIIKAFACNKTERLLTAISKMREVILRCAKYAITPVRVAERNRNSPGHLRMLGNFLISLPRHIIGGAAEAKYRVEQKINRPGTRANNQI